MGGMGGGMGGMGGGMMGGMGGGMGGMGGGMGGRGGMMGGRGGMMGGRGGMGGGVMPASMGMMMLGRLIMTLVGDRDSWDYSSLMMGMMGGMGGGMMGGMGGGMMGGMGGGMGMGGMGMGGMGGGMMGGFRSVPPTGLPHATLEPAQTRHLPTRVVSLNGPNPQGRVLVPAKGEALQIGDISQLTSDPWTQAALRKLAEDKAPPTVSQLVLWHVADGYSWATIAQISRKWANTQELALARQFVDRLRETEGHLAPAPKESGRVYYELTSRDPKNSALADSLRKVLKDTMLLGLEVESGVPTSPHGPALACRVRLDETTALVQVSISNEQGTNWTPVGKLNLDLTNPDNKEPLKAEEVTDQLAESLLSRLADARLVEGKKVHGKQTYKIKILNASPLILNGLALAGEGDGVREGSPALRPGGVQRSAAQDLDRPRQRGDGRAPGLEGRHPCNRRRPQRALKPAKSRTGGTARRAQF